MHCVWELESEVGIQMLDLTGFPPSLKVGNPLSAKADVELTPRE